VATVGPRELDLFLTDVAGYGKAQTAHEEAITRAGYVCCDPATLPLIEIELDPEMLSADWPTIGSAAATTLGAGVDPRDAAAVDARLHDQLDERSLLWALRLFSEPITIGDTSPETAYVDGRHRSACLRRTESPVAVIYSLAAEETARQRLSPPPRPIVPWL